MRLVEDYKRRFAPLLDAALQRFQRMPDLRTAVQNAALARREDGKREHHQRRIKSETLQLFKSAILHQSEEMERCRGFEELHGLIFQCKQDGVGPLTLYDAAWRIGAFLGLSPDVVYLHSGALQGAKALELNTRSKRLPVEHLPEAFSRLAPIHIENFLCIYKKVLERARDTGSDLRKQRGCS